MNAERDSLRRDLRARRRAVSAGERIAGAERLAGRLLALPFAPLRGHVAGYWAVDGEIALHAWQLALPPEISYCLPVLGADARLRFAPWRPGAPLATNRYGIPEPDVAVESLLEPEALQLVVVPLVGFDNEGRRLGMGGGWYDRSFAFRQSRPAPPFLVGVGFECQALEGVSSEPWDVSLDAICTEQRTFVGTRTSG
jgi:5-formyltetrahydrofolate cyclo-ligase